MSYFSSKFSDDLLAVWASGVVLFLVLFRSFVVVVVVVVVVFLIF